MAIVPQLVHRPLDPGASGGRPLNSEETDLIGRMADDGVLFAAHGLTHRTRDPRPRHRSELIGLSRKAVGALIAESLAMLAAFDVVPRVFVPPFNRFAAEQYPQLAARFDVVCGGPESILYLGLQPTPRWLGGAVYCPSYAPLYGTACEALPEVGRAIEARAGTWIPVTLHLSWELDDRLEGLKRLLDRIAPYAASWTGLLEAVDASANGR
jgi:peptidoglycan/xylan/chitin deacetylase (PgdA/CDA1 family)